ncbi:MAG: TonB-dependent receptor [Verrucomicrobiia bacterium]
MQKVISIVICFTAVATAAQQEPSGTPQLPEVTVTSGRLPGESLPVTKTPANVTVITSDQIEQSSELSVPEILTHQVGIQNTDTVGFGIDAKPNMRGYGDRTGVLVLVDGVRMNSPGDSTANALWAAIPPQDIDRIEIIRGGGSTIYGEGAIGGVINIITKHDAKKSFANLDAAAGNLGYWRGHADGGTPWGPSRVYGSATYEQADGARDFSAFYKETAQGNAGVTTAWGDFDAGVYYHRDRVRNPGNLTPQQYHDNPDQAGFATQMDNEITRLSLDWKNSFDSGFSAHIKPYIQSYTEDLSFPSWPSGNYKISQPSWGVTLQMNHTTDALGGQNVATLGGEFIHQNMTCYNFNSNPDGISDYVNHATAGVFAQDAIDVTEKLRLQAGVRYDTRSYDLSLFDWNSFSRTTESLNYSGFSPSGGAVYSFTKTENAYFNISRSYKLPIGNDLISVDPLYRSNADIKPIDATNYEVGFRWARWKEFSGSIALYHSDIQDAIELNPFTYQNQNYDEKRNGIELGLQSSPVKWMSFYLNYTFQDSQFAGGAYDGNSIPLVPQHLIAGGAAWIPVPWFRWSVDVVYGRDQTILNDLNNTFEANRYTVLNTRLTWIPCKWGQVYVAINNMLDDRYETFPSSNGLATRAYNPALPINVQAGFTMKF